MTQSLGEAIPTHTCFEGFASQQIGEANATPSDHTLLNSANLCRVRIAYQAKAPMQVLSASQCLSQLAYQSQQSLA